MERKIVFAPGEYYHVYNRGVNKSLIFKSSHDYWRFIFLLYLCNSDIPVRVDNILRNEQGLPLLKVQELIFEQERGEQIVDIGAYCLMPNHFHLLLKERNDGGISKFMLKLGTAYTMYANKRHARTGAFFEGPFRAEHAGYDQYLKYLFAYIHLNPVKLIEPEWKNTGITDKEQAQKFLSKYDFSSYQEYLGMPTCRSKIIEKGAFPHYFDRQDTFKKFIEDWTTYAEASL